MKLLMQSSVFLLFAAFSAAAQTSDQPQVPKELQGIRIDQRLNAQIPLDAQFRDESGRQVRLGDYFGQKPVILALVYYRCTMLCSYILNGMVSGLRPLSFRAGRDFEVVAISIDPSEDPPLAASKRDNYAHSYSSKDGTAGWHFLTGTEPNIRAVADAVGFHYRYDPATKIFLHASGIMMITPLGRIARYFYGVEFTPKDLKLGLMDASGNRIGSPVDEILLLCYHYDPSKGKYSADVLNLLRFAAGLVLLILIGALAVLFRRDFRLAHARVREAPNL
ncbi:MAG TPA: SCO family protein [Bryobacteraceae bacterium]|nr:SCO family protein [Bryobacteraceae bacterium]